MKKKDKNKGITIDKLAGMIQGEFVILNKKIESLRNDIAELKMDIEDIKLRIGNMAYRFELKDIERRLRKVEIKSGINR